MYHTKAGSYVHEMGIKEGGKLALLASVGPMGLGAIITAKLMSHNCGAVRYVVRNPLVVSALHGGLIPIETLLMDCLLPYHSETYFYGSLAEPMSCIVGTYHAMWTCIRCRK